MKRAVFLFSLFVLISACGDSAPEDAIVTAPANDVTSLLNSPVSTTLIFRPLEFKVTKPEGSGSIPVADIDFEFFAGGGAILTDLAGNIIQDTVGRVIIKTKDNGVATVSLVITIPGCAAGSTTSVVVGASVLGTVGSSSALWSSTITRSCT